MMLLRILLKHYKEFLKNSNHYFFLMGGGGCFIVPSQTNPARPIPVNQLNPARPIKSQS